MRGVPILDGGDCRVDFERLGDHDAAVGVDIVLLQAVNKWEGGRA